MDGKDNKLVPKAMPMSMIGVTKLMLSSESKAEWDKNAEMVKEKHCGKYPEYWLRIILLKVAVYVAAVWSGDKDVRPPVIG